MNIIGVLILSFLLFVMIYSIANFISFVKKLVNGKVDLILLAKCLIAVSVVAIAFHYGPEYADILGIEVSVAEK